MPNVVEIFSYTRKDGVSEQQLLLASDKFHSEFFAKQNGFISWNVLKKGDVYTDIVVYETAEDLDNTLNIAQDHHATLEYNTLVDQVTTYDEMPFYTVIKSY